MIVLILRQVPVFLCVTPEDALVSTTNAAQSSTQSYSKYRILGNGPSCNTTTITHKMSTALINGVSEENVLISPNYQGLVTGSPVDPWYWQIRYSAVDFTTTTTIYGFVHVYMDVIFSDPVTSDTNDYSVEDHILTRAYRPIGSIPHTVRTETKFRDESKHGPAPTPIDQRGGKDEERDEDEIPDGFVEVPTTTLVRKSSLAFNGAHLAGLLSAELKKDAAKSVPLK